MYYVIFAQDIPNTLEKRLAVREQIGRAHV